MFKKKLPLLLNALESSNQNVVRRFVYVPSAGTIQYGTATFDIISLFSGLGNRNRFGTTNLDIENTLSSLGNVDFGGSVNTDIVMDVVATLNGILNGNLNLANTYNLTAKYISTADTTTLKTILMNLYITKQIDYNLNIQQNKAFVLHTHE